MPLPVPSGGAGFFWLRSLAFAVREMRLL